MEKLEIKHLAPYLPYGLYCFAQGHIDEQEKPIPERILGLYDDTEVSITLCEDDSDIYCIEDIFPILRPLSDLTQVDFIDVYEWMSGVYSKKVIDDIINNNQEVELLNYYCILELLKNHFDIFGLIEKGLAIDINTLK